MFPYSLVSIHFSQYWVLITTDLNTLQVFAVRTIRENVACDNESFKQPENLTKLLNLALYRDNERNMLKSLTGTFEMFFPEKHKLNKSKPELSHWLMPLKGSEEQLMCVNVFLFVFFGELTL